MRFLTSLVVLLLLFVLAVEASRVGGAWLFLAGVWIIPVAAWLIQRVGIIQARHRASWSRRTRAGVRISL